VTVIAADVEAVAVAAAVAGMIEEEVVTGMIEEEVVMIEEEVVTATEIEAEIVTEVAGTRWTLAVVIVLNDAPRLPSGIQKGLKPPPLLLLLLMGSKHSRQPRTHTPKFARKH